MKDGALVRGGYSVGCICDDETVICHGDAWLLSSLSTTQAAFRPVIDVTPSLNHPTWRNHTRTSLASKVSAAEHLTRLGIQQAEVRPPFLFTSLVMNFKTSSLLIL